MLEEHAPIDVGDIILAFIYLCIRDDCDNLAQHHLDTCSDTCRQGAFICRVSSCNLIIQLLDVEQFAFEDNDIVCLGCQLAHCPKCHPLSDHLCWACIEAEDDEDDGAIITEDGIWEGDEFTAFVD